VTRLTPLVRQSIFLRGSSSVSEKLMVTDRAWRVA
jgi:hypothetical protein